MPPDLAAVFTTPPARATQIPAAPPMAVPADVELTIDGQVVTAVAGSTILAAEVDWAVRMEGALSLEDVHYRRTRAALYHPEAREAGLVPTARRLAGLLGWSPAREARELAAVRARMAADLAFRNAEAAA